MPGKTKSPVASSPATQPPRGVMEEIPSNEPPKATPRRPTPRKISSAGSKKSQLKTQRQPSTKRSAPLGCTKGCLYQRRLPFLRRRNLRKKARPSPRSAQRSAQSTQGGARKKAKNKNEWRLRKTLLQSLSSKSRPLSATYDAPVPWNDAAWVMSDREFFYAQEKSLFMHAYVSEATGMVFAACCPYAHRGCRPGYKSNCLSSAFMWHK